jgi:hypothetical protein
VTSDHYAPARTIAMMPALTASERLGQASMIVCSSGDSLAMSPLPCPGLMKMICPVFSCYPWGAEANSW